MGDALANEVDQLGHIEGIAPRDEGVAGGQG
jgi:hypothetical protein